MSLLTPLGLIALIGLPLIIIIYILKPKYQEKTINSTYIWRQSLKYRKRKIPLQWLKRSLLLIVQLLIMSILAMMIAQPFIKHPKAQYERIIILDASASMLAVDENGKSRFDKAKEDILHEAEEASQEFDLSIILCDSNPDWLIQNAFSSDGEGTNEEQKALGVNKINIELNNTKCTNAPCDYNAAMDLANEYREANKDAKIILYTDHEFEKTGYVAVKNFATEKEWNASVVSVEEREGGNDTLYFEVTVGSFLKTGELILNSEITGLNGYDEGPRSTLKFTQTIQFNNNETQSFIIRGEKETVLSDGSTEDMRIYSYKEAKFYLTTTTGAEVNDNYKADNEYYCFSRDTDLFNARVEIDQPASVTTDPYVSTALSISGNVNCTEVSDAMKQAAESVSDSDGKPLVYQPPSAVNFDLYVYDGRMPNTLPDDGAVWLLNVPTGWALAQSMGVTVGDVKNLGGMTGIDIVATEDQSVLVKGLSILKSGTDKFSVSQYRPLTVSQDNPYNFETILSVSGEPIMIAGENAQGVRVVITSVDLRRTDLPLFALPVIAKNVVSYSLSHTLENLSYEVGQRVDVYSKPKVTAATVSVDGDKADPLVFNKEKGEFPISFIADKPGVYTVSQEFSNTSVNKETKFFVHVDKDECNFALNGGTLADDDGSVDANDALLNSGAFDMEDITFWFAAAMMLLLLIEWGLQYREQY